MDMVGTPHSSAFVNHVERVHPAGLGSKSLQEMLAEIVLVLTIGVVLIVVVKLVITALTQLAVSLALLWLLKS